MRGESIGLKNFTMIGGKSKDSTAEASLRWTGLSYTDTLKVAVNFNFTSGCLNNPGKGLLLQETITDFVSMYKELVVWPGDGPKVGPSETFDAHSRMLAKLLGQDPDETLQQGDNQAVDDSDWEDEDARDDISEGDEEEEGSDEDLLPGEAGHREQSFPRTTITPYAHMFVCHSGEDYERSKAYAQHFQPDDDTVAAEKFEGRGGLKFALTQALERSNLMFFHQHFQTLARRCEHLMRDAGFQELRRFFNSAKVDRSKLFCNWCGRGFLYNKRCK